MVSQKVEKAKNNFAVSEEEFSIPPFKANESSQLIDIEDEEFNVPRLKVKKNNE